MYIIKYLGFLKRDNKANYTAINMTDIIKIQNPTEFTLKNVYF